VDASQVTNMAFNSSGARLLLWGPRYVGALHVAREGELRGGGKAVPHRRLLADQEVLKAAWHPLSACHAVVLVGDPRGGPAQLRLYDVTALEEAEEAVVEMPPSATSFCFGPQALWQRFAAYVLTREGQVYVACPLLPRRCRVSAWAVLQLRQAVTDLLDCDERKQVRTLIGAWLCYVCLCFTLWGWRLDVHAKASGWGKGA
jgi:hypothetical protein